MNDVVLRSDEGGVRHLRLNRAAKKNALTHEMYDQLAAALSEADDGHRVVLISAEGADFCAGNDIADFVTIAQHQGAIDDLPVFRFLKALTYCPKPVVIAVEGQAVGVGTTMLLHADMVVLSETARLSLPFLKLGLTPEAGSSRLLPWRIGHVKAFEWLAMGSALNATEAQTLGLCNTVTPAGEAFARAQAAALRLAALAPEAIGQTKALMRDPDALWAHIQREGEIFRQRLTSPEAAQAFAAFLRG